MTKLNKNLGYFYFRDYYANFPYLIIDSKQDRDEKTVKAYFEDNVSGKNSAFLQFLFPETIEEYQSIGNVTPIELLTQYPGLSSGLGVGHGIKAKGEFKLGFHFDYTSGMPHIPGSSVKGKLRAIFPNENLRKKNISMDETIGRYDYMTKLLEKITSRNDINEKFIDALELEIFEGKYYDSIEKKYKYFPVSQHDTFFDAYITEGNSLNKVFGTDAITPHGDNPVKNPIPLLFMKILPNVKIKFSFDLFEGQNRLLLKDQKRALFKEILLEFGIGAKTNVGYGQFKAI